SKQTQWDTAYGWGNHASAGYALASALGTAATGTLTTSINDTTLGRVVRVGDHGFGSSTSSVHVFAALADWAKPANWSGFVNLTGSVNTPGGLTTGYIHYQIIAKRDNGNGYAAIAVQ